MDGLRLRLANAADGMALAELERRAPLRLGSDPLTLMTFDRGPDFFAPTRLMEEAFVYVAELDGRLCGVYCGALQPTRIAGEARRLYVEHHCRIDPSVPRAGVFGALADFGRRRFAPGTDSVAFYVARENEALRRHMAGRRPWSVPTVRALLPCERRGVAGAVGRTVGPADTGVVIDVLNACHDRSELFTPYTSTSLAARLGRDPGQYGWSDLRTADGAVAGVSRSLLSVTKDCEGAVARSVRATVLDHGVLPGYEDSYRGLLRWWCREAGKRGATHLAVFTSEGSLTHDVVTELADALDVFDFWSFAIDEPPGLAASGLYVDPVYF